MSATRYHFFPCVRRGLAASITESPDGKRATVSVQLQVDRRPKGSVDWDPKPPIVDQPVELYGPGDVAGFDQRIVVRTDPKPDSGNFEPNYFPAVEFADPDFPWRYSVEPARPEGLTPWITLVVLVAEDQADKATREFEPLPRGRNQVPVIRVFNQDSLPDLSLAKRWAHVQATSEHKTMSEQELVKLLEAQPECVISRLMCPRRLHPKTLYSAFVVPTYKLGWAAGLGTPAARAEAEECRAKDLAWVAGGSGPLDLPYYYSWDFRTSQRGDFEYLVRLLKPRKLEGLGLREIDCAQPGYGLSVERSDLDDSEKVHILHMEGALQCLDTEYTPWGDDRPEPVDKSGLPSEPEPEAFQASLAQDLLSKAYVDQAQVELPEGFDSDGLIRQLAFQVDRDGQTVCVDWRTHGETTCFLEYWPEDPDEGLTGGTAYSDAKSEEHRTLVSLVPEHTYLFKFVITQVSSGIAKTIGNAAIRIPLPAVVPPIYGRWHAARREVYADEQHKGWLDVLNLDPRHRAAAGLGAEVIRKQQEPLMASAWDQIGAIEKANDILRRAQAGRDGSLILHRRLEAMALEDCLRVTAPVQKRIAIADADGAAQTVTTQFGEDKRIPAAVLSPAFRRIARARGPIRKRQGKRPMNLLRRLSSGELRAAGDHPRPAGTPSPCAVTRRMYQQAVFDGTLVPLAVVDPVGDDGSPGVDLPDSIDPTKPGGSPSTVMDEDSSGGSLVRPVDGGADPVGDDGTPGVDLPDSIDPTKLGGSQSTVMDDDSSGGDLVRPVDGGADTATATGVSESTSDSVPVTVSGTGTATATSGVGTHVTGNVANIVNGVGSSDPFADLTPTQIQAIKDSIPVPDNAIRFCDDRLSCRTLLDVIDAGVEGIDPKTILKEALCDAFDSLLHPNPGTSDEQAPPSLDLGELRRQVLAELYPRKTIKERVKNRLRLKGPLADRFDDDAPGDPFDEIMAHPEFPQPMYEPLRDLSQSNVLPGVEKVPQNTLGLLETNGRFLESYMVGLNHEFAGELLWRRYPTDQRGAYFRQFWDVSEYIRTLDPEQEADLMQAYPDMSLDEAVEEALKDIQEIHRWDNTSLGDNDNRKLPPFGEFLVLVVRGDLLKRYPNAVIYAVDAKLVNDKLVPQLPEFGGGGEKRFSYPIFRGSLGADLVFLGFPFTKEMARSDPGDLVNNPGMFFVLEERVTETRFGLDSADVDTHVLNGWDELSWGHFDMSQATQAAQYIDDSSNEYKTENENLKWEPSASSAMKARLSYQNPDRIVVHADQMIPEDAPPVA